jgi:precorrin-3B synthase
MASTLISNLSTPTPNPSPQGEGERGSPARRGACPGLSAPMPTGDGLLVRLLPVGTIPLPAFAALCAAARAYGNGVIEVTSRGSIQVRGLSASVAPQFAAAVAALNIAAQDGIAVHCNPLAGLDGEEIFDSSALAAALRGIIAQCSIPAKLSPKVSVAIDGGGALDLATLAADIRLSAQAVNGDIVLRVGVGGDAAHATDLGAVAPVHGTEAVIRSLNVMAKRRRDSRARDIIAAEGANVFRDALAGLLLARRDDPRKISASEPIGLHRLRDGSLACGIGLAFGHTEAGCLGRLADAALAAGAAGFCAVPERALLTIGLTQESAKTFAAAADKLGFIVHANDPRRHVVACAGSPICASAHIASRALAPIIAEQAARYLDDDVTVHISGCAKGCAQTAPAALTVVGTPEGAALIANGSPQDRAYAVVPAHDLSTAMTAYLHAQKHETAHV